MRSQLFASTYLYRHRGWRLSTTDLVIDSNIFRYCRNTAFSRPISDLSRLHIALALSLALIAFAANSILCRVALGGSDIEPGLFTTIRIFSGAILLVLIARREALRFNVRSWLPAVMLFVYAAGFSYAYVELSAGTGALLLFGSVQLTMLLGSLIGGERFGVRSIAGWVFACAGLALLLLPGAEMAPVRSAALMITAGVAWGIYSLLGKRIADPAPATARPGRSPPGRAGR